MKKNNCFIIAEIGVNHNNNMNLAKKLIIEAKKIGADAVKFQTFKADTLALKKTPKVPYQKRSGSVKESHHLMLKKLELSEKNHFLLKKFCEKKAIEFISTPYDINSARFLNKLGVKTFKVASADIVDHQLHNFLAKTKKKVIISTGMSSMKEIEAVLKIYKKYKNNNYSLLHCVSNYPCSDKSLNLRNILTLKKKFKCKVGFSDHSIGNQASIISVGYGASIIEKHFTLSKSLNGPDHLASSTPKEFKSLVLDINRSSKMLGSYDRKIQNEEKIMRKISRKSIIFNKNLEKGHKLRESDITLIRPGTGLGGDKIQFFLNKKLKRKVKKYSQITFKDV
jgi:N,N'-diacetyllegionaminate synthase